MRYFLIFVLAFLAGCGSAIPTVKPFKMDIQQGNVVTSKMLLQLRPGMTKSQVKFIMGSPLIVDSFHKDRWDYFYQLRQAGKIVEQRRVILDFDKELLTKVRGDVVPEGTAGAATGSESSVAKTITLEPKPKQEKSWTEKLKFWKSDEPTQAPAPVAADKLPATQEKIDATVKTDTLEANKQAPAGDAAGVETPADQAADSDTPSMLAVPIGGVLAPDTPAVDAPAAELPVVAVPAVEAPTVQAPVIAAPVHEPAVVETPPAEAAKLEAPEPAEVPAPAGQAEQRLIFRMDRNLELKNLQTPVEAAPVPKAGNNATPTAAKPRKVEPPLPEEEAPGYFERMLEKIGF